jgi:hypothetical protein
MDAFFASVLSSGPPGLGLAARPGTLKPPAVKTAVAAALDAMGLAPDPDRRLKLEGIALLWHDCWDQAHAIAQAREGEPDFDLLHAFLHRREGDFGNAGYWFRSAGKHPCYLILDRKLAAAPGGLRAVFPTASRWSAEAFLDQVRAELGAGRGLPGQRDGESGGTRLRILTGAQAEEFRAYAEHLLTPR